MFVEAGCAESQYLWFVENIIKRLYKHCPPHGVRWRAPVGLQTWISCRWANHRNILTIA